ncbi:MAG: ribosome small subunit-dependent GTPase A [Spirochaetia bacterium]
MDLEDLGYGDWFRAKLGENLTAETRVARVIAVDRDRYMIGSALGSIPAELTGRLVYYAVTIEDMPCVGDWVLVDYYDDNAHAVVHDMLPRRTILRRRSSGIRVDYQPIAANVDVAFIVQSCDVDYNLNRLDRYIAMTKDGGIDSILLLTKCDLVDGANLEAMIAEVRREHSIDVIPLSSATGAGYDRFRDILEKGKTYCLIGSSGVGKSTILNKLVGKGEFATDSVREKSGKGRHTTTRRQLVVLDNGAIFVDTPGMRELGMLGFSLGIEESFGDIAAIAERCRFTDCTHTTEKGCAVLSSVAKGELTTERYNSYLKLMKESKYYEMTYMEKRKKDKAFGKMVKNYMKFNQKQ